MTKEIANTEALEMDMISALQADLAELGIAEASGCATQFEKQDLLLGRIYICQGNSNLVNEGKCMAGEFYDLTNDEKLPAEPRLSFVNCYKTYQLYEDNGDAVGKYIATLDASEHKFNSSDVYQGQNVEATFCYNFYVLLLTEDKPATPYILTLKGMNKKLGQKLFMNFAKLATKGIPSYAFAYKMGKTLVKTDKGSFNTITAEQEELPLSKDLILKGKELFDSTNIGGALEVRAKATVNANTEDMSLAEDTIPF